MWLSDEKKNCAKTKTNQVANEGIDVNIHYPIIKIETHKSVVFFAALP